MKQVTLGTILAGWAMGAAIMMGQTTPTPAPAAQAPLQLQTLGQQAPAKDPFPAVNPKSFTAPSPTAATVDSFLHALWGFDPNRIWRVAAIQTTAAPGVSKVTVFVSEKTPNAKVQTSAFFVLPDGKHAIADGVISFGPQPFAELRKTLQDRADGPARGATSKDLLLVEFSDLQCPHCKDAQATMDNLVRDFPNARVVFQSFPLVDIHPAAMKAAEYGVCAAGKSPSTFYTYAQAVFDTQAMLTPEDTDKTLAAAAIKAGLDPAAAATCAATPATREAVQASLKLGADAGVDQTPLLAVNGHLLPLTSIPYETLKQIVIFQAQLDGVSTGTAPAAPITGLQQRPAPSLDK